MILSMTGFSSKTSSIGLKGREEISLAIEMKSVNARFFETTVKLPPSLSALEIPIINLLKQNLLRGRVFLSVRLTGDSGVFATVVPMLQVVKGYIDASEKIKDLYNVSGKLDLADLSVLPDVFILEREPVGKKIEQAILCAIDDGVKELIAVRSIEGKHLLVDLEKRFEHCSDHMKSIKQDFSIFMQEQKTKIKKILSKAKSGDSQSEIKLNELYELVNKIDIHEEIVRFQSHLKAVKKLLKDKAFEKGRRLDFMLQELGRETNTIAAKCSHFAISTLAVDIKVELEKVREQIQNIV